MWAKMGLSKPVLDVAKQNAKTEPVKMDFCSIQPINLAGVAIGWDIY